MSRGATGLAASLPLRPAHVISVSMTIVSSKPPTVWALADDRAGNRSQVTGVARATGLPVEVKEVTYGALSALPNVLLGASQFGLSAEARAALTAPWPDIVIGAGRRTAPAVLSVKRRSRGRTKAVQIMDPGARRGGFDLICAPKHDQISGGNVVPLTAAPHGVTPSALDNAREKWREIFRGLPQPLIALIVGGSTRNRRFTIEMARDLGVMVNAAAHAAGGAVLVTTSRRSAEAATAALMDEITAPSYRYLWGDGGENPYLGFLGVADFIVVTGESVSMCSEACASGKPVHIYAPADLISDKHARLHHELFEMGAAKLFDGVLSRDRPAPFNAADEAAAAILSLTECSVPAART